VSGRIWLVSVLVLAGCGSTPTGHLPGARRFVALPMSPDLLSITRSTDGVVVTREGTPDVAFCARACAPAQPPGSRVIGCRTAEATQPTIDALKLPSKAMLLCELP
jgi:hypothetical protein